MEVVVEVIVWMPQSDIVQTISLGFAELLEVDEAEEEEEEEEEVDVGFIIAK